MSTATCSAYRSASVFSELRLALGALQAPLGLCTRAGGQLVGRLVGLLEDAGGLLADLVERALHDLLAQLPSLELVHELP